MRTLLPPRRYAETFELTHGELRARFQVSVGYLETIGIVSVDGAAVLKHEYQYRAAEVFITGAKGGSEVEAIARDGAVVLSLALQYGVPLDVIAGAITRDSKGQPLTVVGAVIDKVNNEKGRPVVQRATVAKGGVNENV